MSRELEGYVMCVSNAGYEASLELRKIYLRLVDRTAARRSLVRVIDESGEDYLYPASFFVAIHVPKDATHIFEEALMSSPNTVT
jgi:hypothetical protein